MILNRDTTPNVRLLEPDIRSNMPLLEDYLIINGNIYDKARNFEKISHLPHAISNGNVMEIQPVYANSVTNWSFPPPANQLQVLNEINDNLKIWNTTSNNSGIPIYNNMAPTGGAVFMERPSPEVLNRLVIPFDATYGMQAVDVTNPREAEPMEVDLIQTHEVIPNALPPPVPENRDVHRMSRAELRVGLVEPTMRRIPEATRGSHLGSPPSDAETRAPRPKRKRAGNRFSSEQQAMLNAHDANVLVDQSLMNSTYQALSEGGVLGQALNPARAREFETATSERRAGSSRYEGQRARRQPVRNTVSAGDALEFQNETQSIRRGHHIVRRLEDGGAEPSRRK